MESLSVVIIGGGPAGSVAAIELANLGIENVLMLESGEYNKFVIGESISPDAKNVFVKLGISSAFLRENHLPCYGVCSYWGNDKRGFNDTVLSPYGHGWHLDRRRFNLFLSSQATHRGTTLRTNASFKKSTTSEDGKHLITYSENEQEINVQADFVIDASGPKSIFAKQQGSVSQDGEPLICLGRRFKINEGEKVSSLTRIEATETGWWYGAKLPGDEILVAFYTTPEHVKQSKLQHVDTWMESLNHTVSIKDGVHEENAIDSKIKGYGVSSFCLDKITGDNWLAIGDAASSFDPITSRGIFKSMTDAIYAAELVSGRLKSNSPIKVFEYYIKSNYKNYLAERAHYYTLEQRWQNAPFWSKFHQLEEVAAVEVRH